MRNAAISAPRAALIAMLKAATPSYSSAMKTGAPPAATYVGKKVRVVQPMKRRTGAQKVLRRRGVSA
jgi:hypothetical protein